MTIGQSVTLDGSQAGLITDCSSADHVTVAITAALTGTLTITDTNGNTVISKTAGQSGAFAVAGKVYRLWYSLSSANDLGLVTVSYRPL